MISGRDTAADQLIPLPPSIEKPVYLLINKVDTVSKSDLLPLMAMMAQKYPFKEIFPISALKADGTSDLLDALAREMPQHPAYYPSDMLSEHSERFFVTEIIREKIFEQFYEEIPYSTTVDIVDFQEREGKKDLICAEIYVERDSQKGMLVGKGGSALKSVGEMARHDIESFLGRQIYLELFVKVRKEWRENKNWLRRLGYTE
jgi:GTP-binding protein Era